VCFWVTHPVTRATSACLLLVEFLFQKMPFLMNINFLIQNCLLPSSNSVPTASFSTVLTIIESLSHPPPSSNSSPPQSQISSPSIEAPSSSPSVEAPSSDNVASPSSDSAQSPSQASSASVHTDTLLSDDQPQLSATESSNPQQPALVRPENVHPMVTRAKAGIV